MTEQITCSGWKDCLTLDYPYDELRGWLLLILVAVLVEFGLSAMLQGYRDGGLSWPPSGRTLTGIWLLSLGAVLAESVIAFIQPFDWQLDLVGFWPVVSLVIPVFLTIWVRHRWHTRGLDD